MIFSGPLDPSAGMAWVVVDAEAGPEFGSEVTLPTGSSVVGAEAVRKAADGAGRNWFCALVVNGEIPDRFAQLRKQLFSKFSFMRSFENSGGGLSLGLHNLLEKGALCLTV